MLIARVVQDQLGDHPDPAPVRLFDENAEVVDGADVGMHVSVIGDVVSVVLARRSADGEQPERVDAEVLEIVEPGGEPAEVADAVAVRIHERPHAQLVDDGVLVPLRIVAKLAAAHLPGLALHGALLP